MTKAAAERLQKTEFAVEDFTRSLFAYLGCASAGRNSWQDIASTQIREAPGGTEVLEEYLHAQRQDELKQRVLADIDQINEVAQHRSTKQV